MADWKNPPRLFIPGPVMVKEDVLQQLARPTLGHRGKEYAQLHGDTVEMLKKILMNEESDVIIGPALGIIRQRDISLDETVLRNLLTAESRSVRLCALNYLASVGSRDHLHLVLPLCNDENPAVSSAARQFVERMKDN